MIRRICKRLLEAASTIIKEEYERFELRRRLTRRTVVRGA